MPNSRGAWVALTAFVAIVMSMFAWFLVVSPQLEATAEVEKERETVAASNDVLATKVAALKAEFAKMEEYRAELARLQVSLPVIAGRDDVFDVLTKLAEDTDVAITSQKAEEPVSLLGDIREKAEEKARAEAEATPTPTATAPSDGATAEPVAPKGWAAPTDEDLVAVPATLDLTGTYENLRDFIDAVQENPERYLLVSSPKFAIADGDADDELKVSLTLYTFAFTDKGQLLATIDGTTEPEAPADAPASKDSPFGTR